jgi:hypothetical protein
VAALASTSDPALKQHNESTYYARLQEERTLRKELQTSLLSERKERKAAETALEAAQRSERAAVEELAQYRAAYDQRVAEAQSQQRAQIDAEIAALKEAHRRHIEDFESRARRLAEANAAEERRKLEQEVYDKLSSRFSDAAGAAGELHARQLADRDARIEKLLAQVGELATRLADSNNHAARLMEHRRKLIEKLQAAIENGVLLKHLQMVFKHLLVSCWIRIRRMHVFLLSLHADLAAHVQDLSAAEEASLATEHATARGRIGFMVQNEFPRWLRRARVWSRIHHNQPAAPSPASMLTNVALVTPPLSVHVAAAAAAAGEENEAEDGEEGAMDGLSQMNLRTRQLRANTTTAASATAPVDTEPQEAVAPDSDNSSPQQRRDAAARRSSGRASTDSTAAAAGLAMVQGSMSPSIGAGPSLLVQPPSPILAGSRGFDDTAAVSISAGTGTAGDSADTTAVSSAAGDGGDLPALLSIVAAARTLARSSTPTTSSARRRSLTASNKITVAENGSYKFSSGQVPPHLQSSPHHHHSHSISHHHASSSPRSPASPSNRRSSLSRKHTLTFSSPSSSPSSFSVGGGFYPEDERQAAAAVRLLRRTQRMDPASTVSAYAPASVQADAWADSVAEAARHPNSGAKSSGALNASSAAGATAAGAGGGAGGASSSAPLPPFRRKWLPRLHEWELCTHLLELPSMLVAHARTAAAREGYYTAAAASFFHRAQEMRMELETVQNERDKMAQALKMLRQKLDNLEHSSSGSPSKNAVKSAAVTASEERSVAAASSKQANAGNSGGSASVTELQRKVSQQESSLTSLRSALAFESHRFALLQERYESLQARSLLQSSGRLPLSGVGQRELGPPVLLSGQERREWIEGHQGARAEKAERRRENMQRDAHLHPHLQQQPHQTNGEAGTDAQHSDTAEPNGTEALGGELSRGVVLPTIAGASARGGGGGNGSQTERILSRERTSQQQAQQRSPLSHRASRASLQHSPSHSSSLFGPNSQFHGGGGIAGAHTTSTVALIQQGRSPYKQSAAQANARKEKQYVLGGGGGGNAGKKHTLSQPKQDGSSVPPPSPPQRATSSATNAPTTPRQRPQQPPRQQPQQHSAGRSGARIHSNSSNVTSPSSAKTPLLQPLPHSQERPPPQQQQQATSDSLAPEEVPTRDLTSASSAFPGSGTDDDAAAEAVGAAATAPVAAAVGATDGDAQQPTASQAPVALT